MHTDDQQSAPMPPEGADCAADQPEATAIALSQTMEAIHRRGWCDGTGGNFSVVLQRDPLQLLMAPSGVDKGDVRPEQLIRVDASGTVLQGTGTASAETALHVQIAESCQAGAILHTHSQSATLLSRWHGPKDPDHTAHLELEGYEMLKGLAGIRSHRDRVRLPVLTNDQDIPRLAQRALPLLPQAPHGLLVAGHGLYAWGRDLATARRHLEILEFLLEQHWRQMLLELLVDRHRQPDLPAHDPHGGAAMDFTAIAAGGAANHEQPDRQRSTERTRSSC